MLHGSSLNPGFSCKACVLTTRALGWFCFTLACFTLEEVARGITDVGVLTSFAWVISRHTLGPSPLATLLSGNTDQGRLFCYLRLQAVVKLSWDCSTELAWRVVGRRRCKVMRSAPGPHWSCCHVHTFWVFQHFSPWAGHRVVSATASAGHGVSSASARGQVIGGQDLWPARRPLGREQWCARRGGNAGCRKGSPVAQAPACMASPASYGACPAAQVKVDADFFNAFTDDFDEDDMRPGAARA